MDAEQAERLFSTAEGAVSRYRVSLEEHVDALRAYRAGENPEPGRYADRADAADNIVYSLREGPLAARREEAALAVRAVSDRVEERIRERTHPLERFFLDASRYRPYRVSEGMREEFEDIDALYGEVVERAREVVEPGHVDGEIAAAPDPLPSGTGWRERLPAATTLAVAAAGAAAGYVVGRRRG